MTNGTYTRSFALQLAQLYAADNCTKGFKDFLKIADKFRCHVYASGTRYWDSVTAGLLIQPVGNREVWLKVVLDGRAELTAYDVTIHLREGAKEDRVEPLVKLSGALKRHTPEGASAIAGPLIKKFLPHYIKGKKTAKEIARIIRLHQIKNGEAL